MSAGAGAPGGPAPQSFAYARSIAPMIWALVALGLCEILVVHLLVALLWSRAVALVLTLATAGTIVWLVAFLRSFRRHPVLIDRDRLVMRIGSRLKVEVPRSEVAAVRTAIAGAQAKGPETLNLALLAFPNVLVELRHPMPAGRRGKIVCAVAHRLDDPEAFCAALAPPAA